MSSSATLVSASSTLPTLEGSRCERLTGASPSATTARSTTFANSRGNTPSLTCALHPIPKLSYACSQSWATSSFTKLNGMFAFAVYDALARKLWLVRDRLGIKPLYFELRSDRLSFASEIKAILALGESAPHCDVSALHEWVYYGNPLGGHTLYKGIRQLLPGHFLEIDLESFEYSIRAYWSLEEQSRDGIEAPRDAQETIERTRRLLEQAVHRQLVSDVPVGLFLSGGVDSSALTAFASRHYGGRLATYSAGFDFARDEGELPEGAAGGRFFRHRASRDSHQRCQRRRPGSGPRSAPRHAVLRCREHPACPDGVEDQCAHKSSAAGRWR